MSNYNSNQASAFLHNQLREELDDYDLSNAWVLVRTEVDNGSTWYDFVHPTWGMASVQEVNGRFSCETEVDTLVEHKNNAQSAWSADCQKVVEAVRELQQKTHGQVFYNSLQNIAQSALVSGIEHNLWAQTQVNLFQLEGNLESTPGMVVYEIGSTHSYAKEISALLTTRITGNAHTFNQQAVPVMGQGQTVRDTLTQLIAKGATWNVERCASANQGNIDLSFFTTATAGYNSNKSATSYDATVFLNGVENFVGNPNVLMAAIEASPKWLWLAGAVVKKLNCQPNISSLFDEFDMEHPATTEVSAFIDLPQPSQLYSRIFNAVGEEAQLFTCDSDSITVHPTFGGNIEDWIEALTAFGFTVDYDGNSDPHEDEDDMDCDEDEDDHYGNRGRKSYGDQVLMAEAIKNDKYTAIQKLLNKGAPEIAEGLSNGRFLVEAIAANNLDALEALMDAGSVVNSQVVAALTQKMSKFDAFVRPVLEKSHNTELLTASVNWQMGLTPNVINPRQRDWIVNEWKNHPHKNTILVNAASHSDTAWRVAPWKSELQQLASTSPDVFFKAIAQATRDGQYNFVRETVRALKIPPSQVMIGSSSLLQFTEQLKTSAGGKIVAKGHPKNPSPMDFFNNPSLFGMGARPVSRQVDPVDSFIQAVKIMEAQFTVQKSTTKRSP